MKVLLVYDLPDWILASIAKELKEHLGNKYKVTTLASHSSGFKWDLVRHQYRNDVVHFLSPWDFFEYSSYLFKPCVVMIWHMTDWSKFRINENRIDVLTTGSDEWLRRIRNESGWKGSLFRIPYGIDTNRFTQLNNARDRFIQKYNLPHDSLIIGFAASAWSNESGRKGIERVWDCIMEANEVLQAPVYLRMIGRHWNIDSIPMRVRKNVIIELNMPSGDLPEYYSSLNCYFCASHMEGVPYPVIESMACNAIPISTPVGIAPEIISSRVNGFLLSRDFAPSQFIEILKELSHNPDSVKRISNNARSYVINHLDWRKLDYSVFTKVYQEAKYNYQRRTLLSKLGHNLSAICRLANYTNMRSLLMKSLKQIKSKAWN